jgi:hypothetical protein
MVIAIPLSAVLVGAVMLTLSIRTWDGLVEDDYYKHGKEINRVLQRDRLARDHAIEATLVLAVGGVTVDLRHDGRLSTPATLELKLLHRTRSGLDRSVLLTMGPDGKYLGQLETGAPGRWIIQLETGIWRVSAEADLMVEDTVELRAI